MKGIINKMGFLHMSNLKDQLARVLPFFRPENLAEQAIRYEGEVALLVIDVQKEFCDPSKKRGNQQTEVIAKRIRALVPQFRQASVPVYAIYFDWSAKKKKKEASEVDFYEFQPEPEDVLVGKDRDSAFTGSDIEKILRKDGRKSLLVCGFNVSACVRDTVMDAREKGFDVTLLEDLAGNDNLNPRTPDAALKEMRQAGIEITQSETVLRQVNVGRNIAVAATV